MILALPRILVIDDQLGSDADLREEFCARHGLIEIPLEGPGEEQKARVDAIAYAVFCAAQRMRNGLIENSVEVAGAAVASGWPSREGQRWALVLLDLHFDSRRPVPEDEYFGLSILERLVSIWPDPASAGNSEIPIVVLSAIERARYGSGANQRGAAEYIEKKALDPAGMRRLLTTYGLVEDPTGRLAGRSLPLLKVLRRARNVAAAAQGNLLILGEPGSGKTTLARYIHEHSPRHRSPFQALSVSAGMEAQLFKAQLFGFWYGAYTPADKSEAGLAERSHGGTLFIDEIGNLPPAAHHELLEYGRLDDQRLRRLNRLGSFPTAPAKAVEQAHASLRGTWHQETQSIFADVFLVAASNKPIADGAYRAAHGFPEDLFVRLAQEYHSPIVFPSLRERREDIVPLFVRFLEDESRRNGGVWPKSLDADVVAAIEAHVWPGNVAELAGFAREVEHASRPWESVYGRHLPSLDRHTGAASTVSPTRIPDVLAGSALQGDYGSQADIDIPGVVQLLSKAEIRDSRRELQGALAHIGVAYGELLERLLTAALELTRDRSLREKDAILGDLSPTRAMSVLLNRALKTDKAADEIKRLAALLSRDPAAGSDIDRVLSWAVALRGGGKRTRSKLSLRTGDKIEDLE